MSHDALVTEFEPGAWGGTTTVPLTVKVHPTVALLNEWIADEELEIETSPSDPYADDSGAAGVTSFDREAGTFTIHLAADALFLSHIAHEATHAALFMYEHTVLTGIPNARASRHIGNHDETIPYLVGSITALLCYWLTAEGFTLDPED